jgi:MoaA/NifB/PqqE/SkfB family radical SAM enzyme
MKMELAREIKSIGYRRVAEAIFNYVAEASDENIVRVLKFAQKIPMVNPNNDIMTGVKYITDVFEKKHPAINVAKKILTQTHPNVRKKIIENWIVNGLLVGTNKRDEYKRKNGVHVPALVVISPTMQCNLNCYGCYAGEYSQAHRGLSFELVDRIITEAKEMGIHFFVISGGEAFVRKDLLEIYDKHNDVGFQIYTNGSLLNDETVARLAELGNVMPCISVEGFEKETDERRGEGHFNRIMASMDRLNKAGVLFGFSATSTCNNTDVILRDDFIDLMIEKGAILGWYFTYIPIGREPDLNLMQTPEQRDYQRGRISEIRNNKPILLADFWNDGWLTNGCIAAGERYLHINSNGDAEPCVFAHFAMDNIKEKSLAEVLDSPLFRKIREMRPYCHNPNRPCMLIDVPKVSRQAFNIAGVYPTHPGAETLFNELAPELDKYSQEYGKLADAALEKHPHRLIHKTEYMTPEKIEKKPGIIRRRLHRRSKIAISGE